MASKKTSIIRFLLAVLVMALLGGCSTSSPTEPSVGTPAPAQDESDTDVQDDAVETATDPGPTTVPEPTLADQDLASVVELRPGEQVQDAQGNLIAIYGIVAWPQTFTALSDASQAEFPFFGDVQTVVDPSTELVVLDIGMCAAGLDVNGFGTAEFFVHASPNDALSTDPVLDRGILTRHPVVRPGFGFPSPAECERGYLPVLSSGNAPAVARYVLASRASAGADIERHVYQWELDPVALAPGEDDLAADPDDVQFGVGQTVTFNQGSLQGATVEIGGWAELIGTTSPLEGTRLVAVSVDFCQASQRSPEFGLGVDNWNIVAPIGGEGLEQQSDDGTISCFAGWLEFAIPFGSVPTAFFASDGTNADSGYAEWSLVDAAIAAPQS